MGGVIVVFAVPMLDKMRIDDVVGAIPVHLFAGIWGTMAVLLTNDDATLMGQVMSILIVGGFVIVTSAVVWIVLKGIMGIRVSEEAEVHGPRHRRAGDGSLPRVHPRLTRCSSGRSSPGPRKIGAAPGDHRGRRFHVWGPHLFLAPITSGGRRRGQSPLPGSHPRLSSAV